MGRQEVKIAPSLIVVMLLDAASMTAKKPRNWQDGKIMAAKTVNTGAVASHGSFIGASPSNAPVIARTITTAELEIFGGDYAYTVRDLGSGAIIKRPCRYIVGDPIKFSQEKSVLYLIDADGAECRAQVMTQERLPPDLKSAAVPPGPSAAPKP
jgi:hypothetical protein